MRAGRPTGLAEHLVSTVCIGPHSVRVMSDDLQTYNGHRGEGCLSEENETLLREVRYGTFENDTGS